jgi:hypothetical protein
VEEVTGVMGVEVDRSANDNGGGCNGGWHLREFLRQMRLYGG